MRMNIPSSSYNVSLSWGSAQLPESEATGHFLAVGAPGSGKSLMLQMLMQDALGTIDDAPDSRALIYDPKVNVLPMLASVCPNVKTISTHPLDVRGAAWDLSRDVREPIVAVEIAFTLIPESQESQPYFSDAARHLLILVMYSLILTGESWGFGTLVRILKKASRIKRVLRKHEVTREFIDQYFGDKRLTHSILSTIATKMLKYEPLAASWEHATHTFSIEEWIRSNQILVLGNCETSRAATDAINRCIFKRACDLTLSCDDSFTRRTWFFIDEVSEAGRLDGLISLLKKGRSKGAAVALAFQSISGLRDAKMFGNHLADEIFGMMATKWFGRLECPTTAEWVAKLFGDHEAPNVSRTVSRQGGEYGTSTTTQLMIKPMVLPAELMSLPTCNRRNGLSGYYITRTAGAFRDVLDGEELFGTLLVPPDENTPGFVPRDGMTQFLRPWSDADLARYGASPTRKIRPSATPAVQPVPSTEFSPPSPEAYRELDELFD